MRFSSNISLNPNFDKIFFFIIFFIFLYPYSINLGGDGLSANYLFVLLPIFIIFLKKKFKKPNNNINLIILYYFIIFFLALFYQIDYLDYVIRRAISFILFMTIFSYLFIDVNDDMITSFKASIIAISLFFILKTLYVYFSMGGSELGVLGKGAVGSQRYGFVYIIAFWIIYIYRPISINLKILKYIGLFIILCGLLTTFSRSSIVSLLGSLLFYFFIVFFNKKIFKIKTLTLFVASILIIICFGYLLNNFLPYTFEFYYRYLFVKFFDDQSASVLSVHLSNPAYSEGYRVYIFVKIIDFISSNPITGSGFLGCWVLFENKSCAAHNQYTDVLFRTGLLGFLIYLYIILRILRYLKNMHKDLFFGVIGVLIYGLFHETFKLSQGAFILSFLFAMTFSIKSNLYKNS